MTFPGLFHSSHSIERTVFHGTGVIKCGLRESLTGIIVKRLSQQWTKNVRRSTVIFAALVYIYHIH